MYKRRSNEHTPRASKNLARAETAEAQVARLTAELDYSQDALLKEVVRKRTALKERDKARAERYQARKDVAAMEAAAMEDKYLHGAVLDALKKARGE